MKYISKCNTFWICFPSVILERVSTKFQLFPCNHWHLQDCFLCCLAFHLKLKSFMQVAGKVRKVHSHFVRVLEYFCIYSGYRQLCFLFLSELLFSVLASILKWAKLQPLDSSKAHLILHQLHLFSQFSIVFLFFLKQHSWNQFEFLMSSLELHEIYQQVIYI